ncbi:low-density lipoprotein receptor-related protein 11 [Anguilla anguilla]|uniref:Low-density lipoprotein receptor-related protein 11 n=1 Tax=Anguilla anguilla TaxID=7936 RepID=A0A9D3MEP1_ANGAN|nr:low-density lipoprotein receptor-related protein 11 [Anguilla anguilla]KAG5846696.1 hypothetical protein ANANG_G00117710 [Anguilla anguilla]
MFCSASHYQRSIACIVLLCSSNIVLAKSSQISDIKSKISGVEELLEEFRKQLQQDQALNREDGLGDVCLSGFSAIEEHIIRAKDSIDQGATFLTAPSRVYSWRDCLHACCVDPRCTVAVVQEDLEQSESSLSCFLFNCTYRNKNVCTFSMQQGYSTYSRLHNTSGYTSPASSHQDFTKQTNSIRRPQDRLSADDPTIQELDEPPRSDASQDLVIQLPTDWAVLDGRGSVDDHGVTRYEWALIRGDHSVNMKVTQPGVLKLSDLQEGSYTFQMTVTDTVGQRSSDNVTVTVLPPEHQADVCTGHCSRHQFECDDGCCIDITYACDGKQQCPDRSDEAFCTSFDGARKAVTHSSRLPAVLRPGSQLKEYNDQAMILDGTGKTMEDANPPVESYNRGNPVPPSLPHVPNGQGGRAGSEPCSAPPAVGPCKAIIPRWYYDPADGACKHFIYGGCKGNTNNFLQETDCAAECIQKPGPVEQKPTTAHPPQKHTETPSPHRVAISEDKVESDIPESKHHPVFGGHPTPASGAILPLALGLIITALLLLMVGCRLRLVHRKLKKARPITSEESDYLINGMYL